MVKWEENKHAYIFKTSNTSNLYKGRSVISPEFSMSLRSMVVVYAIFKFKNNCYILIVQLTHACRATAERERLSYTNTSAMYK